MTRVSAVRLHVDALGFAAAALRRRAYVERIPLPACRFPSDVRSTRSYEAGRNRQVCGYQPTSSLLDPSRSARVGLLSHHCVS
jgi:hypothetical protein